MRNYNLKMKTDRIAVYTTLYTSKERKDFSVDEESKAIEYAREMSKRKDILRVDVYRQKFETCEIQWQEELEEELSC